MTDEQLAGGYGYQRAFVKQKRSDLLAQVKVMGGFSDEFKRLREEMHREANGAHEKASHSSYSIQKPAVNELEICDTEIDYDEEYVDPRETMSLEELHELRMAEIEKFKTAIIDIYQDKVSPQSIFMSDLEDFARDSEANLEIAITPIYMAVLLAQKYACYQLLANKCDWIVDSYKKLYSHSDRTEWDEFLETEFKEELGSLAEDDVEEMLLQATEFDEDIIWDLLYDEDEDEDGNEEVCFWDTIYHTLIYTNDILTNLIQVNHLASEHRYSYDPEEDGEFKNFLTKIVDMHAEVGVLIEKITLTQS